MGLVVGLLKKLRKSELLNKLSCSWTVYFEAQFQVPTNQTKVQMDSTTANESESLCHRCQWPKLTLAQCFTVYKARSYISCLSVSRSVVSDSATPWSVTHQAPLSRGFPRQEYLNGLPFPSPGDLRDPGIELRSPAAPALQTDSLPLSHLGSPYLAIKASETQRWSDLTQLSG